MSLQTIRHMVKRIVPVLTVLFFVVLAVDEWQDAARAMQDMTIETCAEVEPYDFEWDEEDDPHGTVVQTRALAMNAVCPMQGEEGGELCAVAKQSDSMRLGQVRRYAPRKALLSDNCTLT